MRRPLRRICMLVPLLAAGLLVWPQQAAAQQVSVVLQNATLTEALTRVCEAAGYEYFCNADQLRNSAARVTAAFQKTPLKTALDRVFAGSEFTYRLQERTVVVVPRPAEPAPAEPRFVEIAGRVTDGSNHEPMAGVTVVVEGSTIGTSSDADGSYLLKLPMGSYNIVFSFIGYELHQQRFNGRNLADFAAVSLTPAAVEVADVVVTGVYQRKKESFSGAATTFKSKELKSVGTQSVLQSLRTLDPSFKIAENMQFGSDPNRMPDFELRGKSSVIGFKEEYGTDPNQPLFILDGFETTLETVMDLNLNRVASVTLLKDAASTAIYGSKASNGVVVIETKAPEQGRLQLSYKGDFSVTMADLTDYNLMNAGEKLEFETLAGVYTDRTGDMANQLRLDDLRNERLKGIARGIDTYWLNEPLRTGFSHKHNIYAEGGEEKIRYGIGLSYGKVQGVMKGSDRQTIGGNIDLIYRTGKFQFSNKLTLDYQMTDDPAVAFSEYAMANPYYEKYGEDGKVNKYLYYYEDSETGETDIIGNPLWNAHLNNYDKGDKFGFTNNFIIEWFVMKDFRIRGKFGLTHSAGTTETRLSPLHTDFDDLEETEKGLYTHSLSKRTNYEGDLTATYGRVFGGKHSVNAVAGFNFNSMRRIDNGYKASGFTDDQFGAPSFANGYPEGGKSTYLRTETRAASFYVNGGYSYDGRYLLDFNYRADGASMFGTNNRFRNTWSVGVGWNIQNEKFLRDSRFIQLLKLRASVGNPGNQNFAAYQAFSTYAFNGWMTNIFGTGVVLNQLGNPDLAWQQTINYNVGTDISVWGNRVNVTLDYYVKLTDPLLAIVTVPGSMGVRTLTMNAGQQKTNGIEATLKISPVYRPQDRINWNISLNGTHAKARYAKIGNAFSSLNNEGRTSITGTTRYYDGGSPTAIWGVRSAGIDPATGRELFVKRDGSYTFNYDVDDEVVLGDTEPKLEGVIGTTFYYKGFSLGCYLRYSLGAQVFNTALFQKVENIGTAEVFNNQDKRALYDRWSPTHTEAYFKGISLTQKTDKSSRFVMDENYLSGESFSIGYEFTQPFIRKIGLSSLSIQANMNDAFRISTVRNERGIDYPFARTISLSVAATF